MVTDDMFDTDSMSLCLCGKQICYALENCVPMFVNMFLNHYTKNINDCISNKFAVGTSKKLANLRH
jgi:hypothetical protein